MCSQRFSPRQGRRPQAFHGDVLRLHVRPAALANAPIDGILVGDSAAMVMHGHPSTLSASVDLMRLHTEAVARGAPEKFVVADMPFLSFRKGLDPRRSTPRRSS